MRSFLLLITFLALTGVAFSSPEEDDNALLQDIFSATLQDDGGDEGGDGGKETDALSALISSISTDQAEEGGEGGEGGEGSEGGEGGEGGDGTDETVEIEGFASKLKKIFRILKKAGNVLHRHFPNVPLIRKYSKYLRCLPSFQEEIELVTTQSDEEDLETLLNTLEAQAQSDEEISQVQFFRKIFKKAKRFGGRIWRKVKKFGKKAFKIIRAVKKYFKCIKRSIEIRSQEESKQVEEQAMQVLQRAITGRVVRI